MNDLIFVAVWQAALNLSEVSKETGLPPANASAKATALRSQGVPLKCFQRGRKPSAETHAVRSLENAMRAFRGW